MKAHPLGRALELGDVPGPQLARAAGEQLGLGVGGVGEFLASVSTLYRLLRTTGLRSMEAGSCSHSNRVLFRYAQCSGAPTPDAARRTGHPEPYAGRDADLRGDLHGGVHREGSSPMGCPSTGAASPGAGPGGDPMQVFHVRRRRPSGDGSCPEWDSAGRKSHGPALPAPSFIAFLQS